MFWCQYKADAGENESFCFPFCQSRFKYPAEEGCLSRAWRDLIPGGRHPMPMLNRSIDERIFAERSVSNV
jgi:hypothetical protein